MNNVTRSQNAFSLIELLIGLVFLAIGLLAIGGLQITSIRGDAFSYHLTQATYMAHDRLELLKTLPYDSSRLLPNSYKDEEITLQGVTFQREYTVTDNGSLKTIRCTVCWMDGKDHCVTLSTLRSQ